MLSAAARAGSSPVRRAVSRVTSVNMGTMTPSKSAKEKRVGDISDSFASLSGLKNEPLPDQFRQLKLHLSKGREEEIKSSWNRLLSKLKVENEIVAEKGPSVIPEVRFSHLDDDLHSARQEIKRRGTVIVRGVIPEQETRQYKFELEDYIRKNPQTHGTYDKLYPTPAFPFTFSK